MSAIQRYLDHLIFPEMCMVCFTEFCASYDNPLCMTCAINMPYTDHFKKKQNAAAPKFWGRIPCVDVASMINFYPHTDIRKMIHALKYQGNKEIGYQLGVLMGKRALASPFFAEIDLIVAIPLHPSKELKRGYNQSEWIAKGVSEILNVKVRSDVIIKHTNTKSQTKMGRIERVKNVYSSFQLIDKEGIQGRHVLIIDDVLTTGATIEACGNRLLEARGVKLSIMTACIARN